MSAAMDIVETTVTAGAVSLLIAIPIVAVLGRWGRAIENRLQAVEDLTGEAGGKLPERTARPVIEPGPSGAAMVRAMKEGRTQAFEEAAEHLLGLQGQNIPVDQMLRIMAAFFLREADRARPGSGQNQNASNPFPQRPNKSDPERHLPRLVIAAAAALKAYRAIFAAGCWNDHDRRAFAELEAALDEARVAGEIS